MNATQDIAMKSASGPASLMNTPATTSTRTEQREQNLRCFQAKYDTMLYIVEFIATFQLLNTWNPKQAKK